MSLAPDMTPWLDPLDARGMHWGVFCDAELVAAARLCVHTSLDERADAAPFRSRDFVLRGPVAVMSHCVVHPRLRALRLDHALDAARIERARQLQIGTVLAVTESATRIAALEAQGFVALGSTDGRCGLVLHLARKPDARVIRMRRPSGT